MYDHTWTCASTYRTEGINNNITLQGDRNKYLYLYELFGTQGEVPGSNRTFHTYPKYAPYYPSFALPIHIFSALSRLIVKETCIFACTHDILSEL